MGEGCTCPSLLVFLLCFSSSFTPYKSHRKGEVCVYLDVSSKKRAPICKISTFGRKLPLTDCFTSHHFHSTAIHSHTCCHFHDQQWLEIEVRHNWQWYRFLHCICLRERASGVHNFSSLTEFFTHRKQSQIILNFIHNLIINEPYSDSFWYEVLSGIG